MLDSKSSDLLNTPEKLKYFLCPILVQGRAEQERFYELFDQYWEHVKQPWEVPPLAEPTVQKNLFPPWLRWVLAFLLIAGMGYGLGRLIIRKNTPELKIAFDHPPTVRIGDTIHFKNLSEHIDSSALRWEIVNPANDSIEHIDTQSFDLHFLVKTAGENPTREVRLTCLNTPDAATGMPASHTSSFKIDCNFPPTFVGFSAPKEAAVGEGVKFNIQLADSADVEVVWDFGDESDTEAELKPAIDKNSKNTRTTKPRPVPPKEKKKITGQKALHSFSKKGLFEVRATATRSGLEGFCSVDTTWRISIGREDALLAAKPLIRDTLDPTISFSWGTWILLGLLGLAMIWYWVKWVARKPPPPPAGGEDLTAAAIRYQSADKAPYFIPFRAQEGHIRVERELYRLADVLRQRQEGLRNTFDVPASVNRTIGEGGFPRLLTRTDTVPTEYLFLIDEQTQQSHQRRLAEFIVQFLRQREVLGEAYYFNGSLHRFWNAQQPGGLSPEMLHRLHPHHRLIVLADGHSLLDPTATAKPAIRPEAANFLSQWKYRLLLTPLPVISWTYREGVLHSLFAIFPSDTDGLGEAMKYIERGILDEERPAYAAWCERLLEGRQETTVNYRRWRTAADHRDYLKDYPALYRWLCSLAVYPKPDWSITLAIGRALAPLGVELSYDHLLLLSRIPWLVSGDLSPRLRQELLADLDPEAERLARQAVQAELKAVELLVQGSQVNQEHQINLALQNFAIAPDDPEAQTAVRQLLRLNLLSPRHLADLNTAVERHTRQSATGSQPSAVRGQEQAIELFLEENKAKAKAPQKPFFTKDFWRAAGATLLYLLIFLFAWNTKSETLARWFGENLTSSARCEERYLAGGMVKKECTADSARLYNNMAVNIFTNMAGDATEKTVLVLRQANELSIETAFSFFDKALQLKPDYRLAAFNRLDLRYNLGVQAYNAFVVDSSSTAGLEMAMSHFRRVLATKDEALKLVQGSSRDTMAVMIAADALHGLGLSHFYLEREDKAPPDSSLLFYHEILALDSAYFDSLDTYPHLQSLLFKKLNTGQRLVTMQVVHAVTGKPVDKVLVTGDNFQRQTDGNGNVQVEMSMGERRTFQFTKKGFQTGQQEIRTDPQNLALTVRLQPVEAAPKQLLSTTAVIYFDPDGLSLRTDARKALDEVGNLLLKNPDWKLEINGHTDDNGTQAYGLKISQSRANAVADYLAKKGVPRESLTIVASGDKKPARPNTTEQNRLANHRVELNIVKPSADKQSTPPKGDATIQQPQKDIPIPEMVFIQGGTFRMGCDDKLDGDCQPDEKPVHDVTLNDYYLGKYEVTNEEYAAFLNDYGLTNVKAGTYKGEVMIAEHDWGIAFRSQGDISKAYFEPQKGYANHPVIHVTWYGANEYCNWLSQKTGKQYRLPTEAEWEYAARGGAKSSMSKYSGGNSLGDVGWYLENSRGQTHPAGQRKANELGIYDMSGNVWEWCSDWYREDYYQQYEMARNPKGPNNGVERILRGGAWSTVNYGCRVADRVSGFPNKGNDSNGFRLVQE